MMFRFAFYSLVSFLAAGDLVAGDWLQWRGSGGNGVVPAGEYPTEYSLEENLDWKLDLPGKGSSTPVVMGGKLFLTKEGKATTV